MVSKRLYVNGLPATRISDNAKQRGRSNGIFISEIGVLIVDHSVPMGSVQFYLCH